MPIAPWKDDFSVNVTDIDRQYQKLLELVNTFPLHAAVMARIDKEDLHHLLEELVEYTRTRFSTEEQMMKKYGYLNLKEHHKEPRQLLRHLDKHVKSVADTTRPTFYSDYDISSDWAQMHISESDRIFGKFINSRDVF